MAPAGLRGGGGHPGLRMGASGSEPQEGQCGRLVGASLAGVIISCGDKEGSCQPGQARGSLDLDLAAMETIISYGQSQRLCMTMGRRFGGKGG